MTTHSHPLPENAMVSCDVCQKEIPLSEANRFEAEDYVAHFCGLECFSTWKQRSEVKKRQGEKG
ncbi:MAG: DUF3330 domain-containing protein [Sideroxydans sp.]